MPAGERLVEELAPELLAALVGMPSGLPAYNFVPVTNTLLAELQRRGVSRDQLLSTLQSIGAAEVPAAAVGLLREMAARQVRVQAVLCTVDNPSCCAQHGRRQRPLKVPPVMLFHFVTMSPCTVHKLTQRLPTASSFTTCFHLFTILSSSC